MGRNKMKPCWIVYREGLYSKEYLKRVVSYKKKIFFATIIREKAFPYTVFENAIKASLSFHGLIESGDLDYDTSNGKWAIKIFS